MTNIEAVVVVLVPALVALVVVYAVRLFLAGR